MSMIHASTLHPGDRIVLDGRERILLHVVAYGHAPDLRAVVLSFTDGGMVDFAGDPMVRAA